MRVVFMEEVEGTARVGEVKNVADGFARNYLLPRRLAAPATEHYVTIAEARAEKEARRQARLDEEARTHLVPKMEGQSVTIEVRVGEQGKLFGSVTARDIADALQEATSVELEHRQVDLRQPIREVGSHEVAVKLTRNVPVQVTVNVEPLGGMPEEAEGDEAPEAAEGAEAETAEAEAKAAVEEAPEPAGEPETAEPAAAEEVKVEEPTAEEEAEEEQSAEPEPAEEAKTEEAEPEVEAEAEAEGADEQEPEEAEEERSAEPTEKADVEESEMEPEAEGEQA